jgi:hypothetical protein
VLVELHSHQPLIVGRQNGLGKLLSVTLPPEAAAAAAAAAGGNHTMTAQ